MKRILSLLLLFCFDSYGIVQQGSLEETLISRYGEEIVAKASHILEEQQELKACMNAIEEQFAKDCEARCYHHIETYQPSAQIQELLSRCKALENPHARCKYAFELLKYLAFIHEIPSFSTSAYIREQAAFLHLILDVLEKDQSISMEDYPSDSHNPLVRYVGKSGVFKHSLGERDGEIAFWEMSCLLGIEEVSVATSPIVLQNQVGQLQRFVKYDVKKGQEHYFKLHSWITRETYLSTALAVLLFALKDIHPNNMAYTLVDNGYFNIKLIDTVNIFESADFIAVHTKGLLTLNAPFAWIGWDYPQATMKLTKKEWRQCNILSQRWKQNDIFAYASHPLTTVIFSEEILEQMINRMHILQAVFSSSTRISTRALLDTVCPKYPDIRSHLHYFFPGKRANGLLFDLFWKPEKIQGQLKADQQAAFEEWIDSFNS